MIYIIDNHFADNHKENCIIIKNTEFSIDEMTLIIGSLGNLYFYSTDQRVCPPRKLLEVLCSKFDCKDRKHKYTGELEFIERRIESPMLHTSFVLHDELIIWLDIKEATNYTFGMMWSVLNRHLFPADLEEIKMKWKTNE